MDDLVGGVFVLPGWLAPWRVRREAPSPVVERPPFRPRVPSRTLVETIWEQYFRPITNEYGMLPTECRRVRELFVAVVQDRMAQGLPAREAFIAGQEAVRPYMKKRGSSLYTINGVQRCDYC